MWRCWWVSQELNARGYVADYVRFGDLESIRLLLEYGRWNTVVIPRMAFETDEHEQQWHDFIDPFRSRIKLWYDLDDDMLSEEFVARQVETTRELGSPIEAETIQERSEFQRRSRIRLIADCDGVTCGSYPIVTLASRIHPKALTLRLRNGINHRFFHDNLHQKERIIPYTTIGWSGGPRLERDLNPLYEVWPKVAAAVPDVHFMLQGWAPAKLASILPPERVHVIGGVQPEFYPSMLKNIDIFCCVATDDDFATAKTPIKFYESALTGSVSVVSEPLYGVAVEHGKTGFIARSVDDWVTFLVELAQDKALRERTNANAYEEVVTYQSIAQIYKDWVAGWSSLL